MVLIENMFEDREDLFEEGRRKIRRGFMKTSKSIPKFTLRGKTKVPKVIGRSVKNIPRAKPKALTKEVRTVEDNIEPLSVPESKKPKLTFFGIDVG